MRQRLRSIIQCGAAASLLLPLGGMPSLAHADASDTPTVLVASKPRLAASECLSLVAQRPPVRGSSEQNAPALRNRCDYEVVVSYCIDDVGRASPACDAVGARTGAPQRIAAHRTLALALASPTLAVGNDVNWIACRSLPGVSSRLLDGGHAGQCRAPAPILQALAHEETPHAP